MTWRSIVDFGGTTEGPRITSAGITFATRGNNPLVAERFTFGLIDLNTNVAVHEMCPYKHGSIAIPYVPLRSHLRSRLQVGHHNAPNHC